MRRGYHNKGFFFSEDAALLGINFGSAFTAEHEWGIKNIKNAFGISSCEYDFGLERRRISCLPNSGFGWSHGPRPDSEGIYFTPYYKTAPDFSRNSELFMQGKGLVCAWDGDSFATFSAIPEEIAHLKTIYDSFRHLDGAIFLGGNRLPVFDNPGLVLAIASRIPKHFIDGWEKADKDDYDLEQEIKATGIRELLASRGCRYYALSPRRQADGSLLFWLNPQDHHKNKSGWVTIEDLIEWTDGKGKVPKEQQKGQYDGPEPGRN